MPQAIPPLTHHPALQDKTFLVGLGAAKCATSWLHAYLGTLPGMVPSPLKEVQFFNTKFPAGAMTRPDAMALTRLRLHLEDSADPAADLRTNPAFQADLDRARMIYDDDAYFSHFARLCCPDTTALADITPAYSTLGPDGLSYLKSFFATQTCRLRLLFIMRDPVTRFWSQLRHLEQINPTERATQNWRLALQAPPLMMRADYRAIVTALDALLPPEDVLYLFYETLFEEHSLRRLCTFCDLPYRPAEPQTRSNETRVKAPLPNEARAAIAQALAPQYAFARQRFGAEIPDNWTPSST